MAADKALLAKYRQLAEQLEGNKQANQNPKSAIQNFPPVPSLGRLATYRYMEIETVIGEALDFADKFVHAFKANEPRPVFPNSEDNS